MRGPPSPVPVTEHARDRRGQAPPLRRGPRSPAGFQPPQKPSPHRGEGVAARAAADEGASSPRTSHRTCQRQAGASPALRRGPKSPAGFQPPQKPSPHRGEGVAARAVTDEGASSPRTSHRTCQRQAGASPAPAQRPKISRRLPAAPKAFPLWGKVWRREPWRMRGPPSPVPVTEHARDRRGQAPPLRRGPRSPAGFQPPQKPSPHRGEGVAARAAADEGSSFLRPTHRICQRRGAQSAPLRRDRKRPCPQLPPPSCTPAYNPAPPHDNI